MNSYERKSLIEKVAFRWNKEGIKKLSELGSFKKYSPFFYFRIGEPLPEQNFILITELFGHHSLTPDIALPYSFTGMRRQLYGDYEGLKEIRLHGLTKPNFKPFETEQTGIGKYKTTIISPTKTTMKPIQEDYELFDNALLYLDHITKNSNPKSFNLDPYGEEFFSPLNDL